MMFEGLVRDAPQQIVTYWSSLFVVVEEMDSDFCLYVSPFPSTMVTARQPHAAVLPLKDFFLLSTP